MCNRHAPPVVARLALALAAGFCLGTLAPPAAAQICPEAPPLQLYAGGGSAVCPCFVAGERAAVVLQAPPEHYPIEVLRVGIGWGSQYGVAPTQIEQAIQIYPAGLPNPGTPIFTLPGPVLTDGTINEFDLEPLPGEIVIASGPFTVALEFMNANAGSVWSPSILHDANGCQPGLNLVYAIPGGWTNACALGVTGDWIIFIVYRPTCPTGVAGGPAPGDDVYILGVSPNPTHGRTELAFSLAAGGPTSVSVHDLRGRLVADLASRFYPAGTHRMAWDGRDATGRLLPAGMYFVQVRAGERRTVQRVMLLR